MNKKLLAIGFASALAIGVASPSVAAPVMSSTQTVKATAPDHVTDVQWRRHHRRGIGPALAAGAIIGTAAGLAAAATAPPYYGPYGAPYGYYEAPVASYGYYEAPVASYGYAPGYYDAPQFNQPRSDSCRTIDAWGNRAPC